MCIRLGLTFFSLSLRNNRKLRPLRCPFFDMPRKEVKRDPGEHLRERVFSMREVLAPVPPAVYCLRRKSDIRLDGLLLPFDPEQSGPV